MQNRTINDEIIDIVNSIIEEQAYPLKCTILKIYNDGYTDIKTEEYGYLTYVKTIGNPKLLDEGLLIFIDNDFNKKIVITTVPKKTSQLENDSGFITKHQDLPEIVDNLTTDDATKVLSARQGKVLKTSLDSLNGSNLKINSSSIISIENEVNSKVSNTDERLTNARTPVSHATNSTTYGGGTSTNYGHIKLSDSYTSNVSADNSVGASSKAVADCYTALDGIKQNHFALWYSNDSRNTPDMEIHDRENSLEIKSNTPIKVYVYMNNTNVCDLNVDVSEIYAKFELADVVYTKYMDTTTKSINMNITWGAGITTNAKIYAFWNGNFIASDVIKIEVVNNYSA